MNGQLLGSRRQANPLPCDLDDLGWQSRLSGRDSGIQPNRSNNDATDRKDCVRQSFARVRVSTPVRQNLIARFSSGEHFEGPPIVVGNACVVRLASKAATDRLMWPAEPHIAHLGARHRDDA
jgi:hypothetical protein